MDNEKKGKLDISRRVLSGYFRQLGLLEDNEEIARGIVYSAVTDSLHIDVEIVWEKIGKKGVV